MKNKELVFFDFHGIKLGSIIPELQNRVTHCDVRNSVTNTKIWFLKIFKLATLCERNFNIIVELVTRDFKGKENVRVTSSKKKK